MTKFLISFPSPAMVVPQDELAAVSEASRAMVREAKAAGVWVFGGGITGVVPSVMVAGDGSVMPGTYPQTKEIEGGYAVLDVPTREEAIQWAAKLAAACRCAQELREFAHDPES